MTQVFDVNGQRRDLAWLAANYDGCHPQYVKNKLDITKYEFVFRLAAVYCTEGPATFKAEIRDTNGVPRSGNYAVLSWPSLTSPSGDLQDLTGSGAPYVWTNRGVPQLSNDQGYAGFGLGGTYGPFYQAWVLSPSTPSDCLVGAGMKGGTNHRGPLHGVWVLSPVGDAPAPPVPPDPGGDVMAAVTALHADVLRLGQHLGAW